MIKTWLPVFIKEDRAERVRCIALVTDAESQLALSDHVLS